MISENTTSTAPVEPPPPPVEPKAPPPERKPGGHEQLIRAVRFRQRRQLWLQGALYGAAAALALALAAGFLGSAHPNLARWLLIAGPIAWAVTTAAFGVLMALARVGDDLRTARLVGQRVPELSHDVLAAVELRRELDGEVPFSKELARAFLLRLDERIATLDTARVVDTRRTRLAAGALAVVALVAVVLLAGWPEAWRRGVSAAFAARTEAAAPAARDPITGDVELTYRYPAYTGLAPRTVPGTSGEISAPAGTEVEINTRADRDVSRAELVVNGRKVPLQVTNERDLAGRLVLDQSGTYRFIFYGRASRVLAEGPDIPIQVEADASPQVRLSSPAEELEIDPGEKVVLKYDASDDYGITSLELVYRAPGRPEQRLPLRHDEGRRSKGQHTWDVADIRLNPGQRVTYYLEVKDNDAVAGPKKGVSRTQVLKLYSAAEHRREAVRKVEALWDRMVLQLADRLEGPDRAKEKDLAKISAAQAVDAAGVQLAADCVTTSHEIAEDRDAPTELVAALINIGEGLRRRVLFTSDARRLFLRYQRQGDPDLELGKRLSHAVVTEIDELEKDVLYLESLLDRQKMQDLRELARELQRQRRELSALIEEFKKTQDPALRDSILGEIQEMRERISELMQRMAELAKGIRDEHLNQEALQELMQERDLSSALDEIERLMREGKTDEALAKLQELAMQMDEMLQNLDDAEQRAGEEQFPELARKFQEFIDDLKETTEAQRRLADKTRELRERYRDQLRDRLKQRGQALKDELLRKSDEVYRDYQQLAQQPLGSRGDKALEEAQAELENLKSALKVEDYDLAAEAAARAERASRELADYGEQQKQLDEVFQNPAEARRQSRELAERLGKDAAKVSDVSQKLQQLFPQPGSMMSEADKQKLRAMGQEQRELERQAQGLKRQMDEMAQMAPIFGEEAQEQMEQVGQRMGEAAERMEARDPNRGYGEQRAALEQLQQFQKQMQESGQGGGGKGGLPLPMLAGKRDGWGRRSDKEVEIPDEDQFQAPKEFRKDLLDAMKQGAPDKYRDQVKRYYEELVK